MTNEIGEKIALRKLKGSPPTFDTKKFTSDLTQLQQQTSTSSEIIRLPVYDRKLHDPVDNAIEIGPNTSFVIVEGMLLLLDDFGFEDVKKKLDIVLFLDVSEERCHTRLVERKSIFGRISKEEAEMHYERVDKKNVQRVLQTKKYAHVLLKMEHLNQQ